MIKRFLIAIGSMAVAIVLGFIFSVEIIGALDDWSPQFFDRHLGTNRELIVKLHEPGYFAGETKIISENQEIAACISLPEHRVLIKDSGDIPDLFKKAILASEDQTFFEHPGFEKWAILRASITRYVLHTSTSGASTLTMQIVKELRGGMGRESTKKEKLGDMVMALRIEREFPSKYQLLRFYMNTPYFGRTKYGIEAASRAYFGKPSKELELHQVAFVVSLIPRPALPDRQFARDRSARTPDEIKRANWRMVLRGTRRVLERMEDNGFITDLEYARAADAVDQRLEKEILPRG
ncbi:MAG: biosynthetic peptidoglycan transglycosylase, partial [Patescibacteria group bacterium]